MTKITAKISDHPNLQSLVDLTTELRDARRATEAIALQRDESGRITGAVKMPPDVAPIVARGVALTRKLVTEHLEGDAHLLWLAVEADFADAAGWSDVAALDRDLLREEGVRGA